MSKRGENITKRKDGRWEARVIKGYDCNGKAQYHYIYGKSYSEAKNKKIEYLSGRQKNSKKDNVLFSSVLSEFLLVHKNRVKPSTLSRYQDIIKLHIDPMLGGIQVKDITTPIIQQFVNNKIENGRVDGSGGLSPKRVRDILSLVKLVLNYSQEQGYSNQNIKICLPRDKTPHIEIFSKEEEAKLLVCSINSVDPIKIGMIISLCTGIRIGELCALRWSDIDVETKLITINKTLQRISDPQAEKKTKVIIDIPKSKTSERQVPIPSFLHERLQLLSQQVQSPTNYVLTSSEKYIEPSNYYVRYQRWLDQCGIDSHSFHALRHTFATRAIECGMDVKTLSEILGHSDVKITLARYVHPSIELKSTNMEKINMYICSQLNSHDMGNTIQQA